MVLEQEILPYLQWLLYGSDSSLGALPRFLLVVVGIVALALVLSYLFSAARHGLLRGGDIVFSAISTGIKDLLHLSPRRVWALARLAIKESMRRRVVVALVVFLVILLFASWFLKTDHQDPEKLYLSFVLTATTYLVLGIALLLSAFSLPSDFKTKTIYTVVTKPVRSGEIILGRILGFSLVGTVLLVVMGVCSYVFVVRSLDHQHRIEAGQLKHISDRSGEVVGYEGQTSLESYHRHQVELDADRQGVAQSMHGHRHAVVAQGEGQEVLPPMDVLQARVPQWGKLSFLDRHGVAKQFGISVGSEWTYRSFIDGGTQAAAIWKFEGVTREKFPDGLPLGLIVRVFRTHKGVIGQAITGSIQVYNIETGAKSDLFPFDALDAQVAELMIDRKLTDPDENEIDLFDDLVSPQGEVEVRIQCLERGQYFGFAQPDCYLRLPSASPIWNYCKVYLSIWVQMVIVTCIGVAASAVVSGPVAMLLTVSFILLGFFRQFFEGVALGTEFGGGPLESFYRMVTQKNIISPLDPGVGATVIQSIDALLRGLMWSVAQVLPDFAASSTVNFAAYGFNVPADRVLEDLTTCLAYVVGLAVIGYFVLRNREIAK